MAAVNYLEYIQDNFPIEDRIVERLQKELKQNAQIGQEQPTRSGDISPTEDHSERIGRKYDQVLQKLAACSALHALEDKKLCALLRNDDPTLYTEIDKLVNEDAKINAEEHAEKLYSRAEEYADLLELYDRATKDKTITIQSLAPESYSSLINDGSQSDRPAGTTSRSISSLLVVVFESCIQIDANWILADLADRSGDLEAETKYVDQSLEAVEKIICRLDSAASAIMAAIIAGTSLLEIALDYHKLMSAYFTLRRVFGVRKNKLGSRKINTRAKKYLRDSFSGCGFDADFEEEDYFDSSCKFDNYKWDDGLGKIRDALSRKSNVDGKSMSLDSNEELRNWRRITGADRFTEQTTLRSALTISIRKIFHHLGASTEEETQRIALVQGGKKAILGLRPISELRSTLYNSMRQVLDGNCYDQVEDDNTESHKIPKDFARIRTSPCVLKGHPGPVQSVAFDPKEGKWVSCSEDGKVIVWNTSVAEWDRTYYSRFEPLYFVVVTADGSHILSGPKRGTVLERDPGDGRETRVCDFGEDFINHLAISPDNRLIAIARVSGKITLWDILNKKEKFSFQADASSGVSRVAFGPGNRLASCSDLSCVRVWDTKKKKKALDTFNGERNEKLLCIAMTRNGEQVVMGSEKGNIIIWTWSKEESKRKVAKIPNAHVGRVICVATFPDNKRFASGGSDGLIKVWDMNEEALILTLRGHTEKVFSIAVHPDGSLLASSSCDETVRVWDLEESSDEIRPPQESL